MAPNFSKYVNKHHTVAAAGLATLIWIIVKRNAAKSRKEQR